MMVTLISDWQKGLIESVTGRCVVVYIASGICLRCKILKDLIYPSGFSEITFDMRGLGNAIIKDEDTFKCKFRFTERLWLLEVANGPYENELLAQAIQEMMAVCTRPGKHSNST